MIYGDLAKAVGDCIKDGRIRKGLTLEELAKAIGVTKATAQKYETGQIQKIGAAKLQSLAQVLDIDMLRLSPAYYGSLNHWAEMNDTVDTLKSMLAELYGERMWLLVDRATQLTSEGQEKLLDRVGELLETPRYNLAVQEVKADEQRKYSKHYAKSE